MLLHSVNASQASCKCKRSAKGKGKLFSQVGTWRGSEEVQGLQNLARLWSGSVWSSEPENDIGLSFSNPHITETSRTYSWLSFLIIFLTTIISHQHQYQNDNSETKTNRVSSHHPELVDVPVREVGLVQDCHLLVMMMMRKITIQMMLVNIVTWMSP